MEKWRKKNLKTSKQLYKLNVVEQVTLFKSEIPILVVQLFSTNGLDGQLLRSEHDSGQKGLI